VYAPHVPLVLTRRVLHPLVPLVAWELTNLCLGLPLARYAQVVAFRMLEVCLSAQCAMWVNTVSSLVVPISLAALIALPALFSLPKSSSPARTVRPVRMVLPPLPLRVFNAPLAPIRIQLAALAAYLVISAHIHRMRNQCRASLVQLELTRIP